jgi:protein SCO1/2
VPPTTAEGGEGQIKLDRAVRSQGKSGSEKFRVLKKIMIMNWRLASRLSVITLAVLVVALVAILQRNNTRVAHTSVTSITGNTNTSGLQGTNLGNIPAPDFRLTDQFSKQVALSQFKGKPVVLTFLYTNCPDQCPLTAEKLHSTMQALGSDAQNVGVIAVSTDPKRDTVEAALTFSKMHNMQDYWHYLIGTHDTLSPVWKSYSIYAQPGQQTVNHSLGVFVIDKQGRECVFLSNDFTPDQLAANLKLLLKE